RRSYLVGSLLPDAVPERVVDGGRRATGRATAGCATTPNTDEENNNSNAEKKSGEGDDPGVNVETAAERSGEDSWAVFADEPIEHAVIGQPGRDFRAEFSNHAVGVRTADVVALEEHLAAAADAHELVAESVEARRGSASAE